MTSEMRFSLGVAALTGLACTGLAATAMFMTRLSGGIALIWFANGVLLSALCLLRSRGVGTNRAVVLGGERGGDADFSLVTASGRSSSRLPTCWKAHWRRRCCGGSEFAAIRSRTCARCCCSPARRACSRQRYPKLLARSRPATTYHAPFARTWLEWWAGHGLGAVITAPLLMLFPINRLLRSPDARRARPAARKRRLADLATAAAVYGLVAAVAFAVFAQAHLPLLFLPALPMMIAAFTLGRVGAAGSLLLVAVIAGLATAQGNGPIAGLEATSGFRFQFVQFYLATLFLMALPAAAILNQQRRLFAQLKASEQALRHVTEHSSDIWSGSIGQGIFRYASPSIARIGDHDPAALIGRNAGRTDRPRLPRGTGGGALPRDEGTG